MIAKKMLLKAAKEQPLATARACGDALGTTGFIPHFLKAFGESLLSSNKVPQRIDWMFADKSRQLPTDLEINERLQLGWNSEIPWIKDRSGNYNFNRIMLLKERQGDLETYAIRLFIDAGEVKGRYLREHWDRAVGNEPTFDNVKEVPHSQWHAFWNFLVNEDGNIEINGRSDGFDDMQETNAVTRLITWSTNVLGFSN